MNLGRQGSELLALYAQRIEEEARLLNRLDALLQEGCRDLTQVLLLSQEVFTAHAQSANAYLRLRKYRDDRNLGLEHDDAP